MADAQAKDELWFRAMLCRVRKLGRQPCPCQPLEAVQAQHTALLETHSWWAAMPLEMHSESSLRLMGNLQAGHTMHERDALLYKT